MSTLRMAPPSDRWWTRLLRGDQWGVPLLSMIFLATLGLPAAETAPRALGKDPAAKGDQPIGNRTNPLLAIRCDRPILRLAEPPAKTTTTLQALTYHFPPGAKLRYAWKQVQDELSPLAVPLAENRIALSSTSSERVDATFPAWGVYAIRVTVTDTVSKISLSRNSWVSVWNNRSTIGGDDALYTAPGILPPPSVRHFNPDPGPFAHPRLLCTPMDWADIHQRCVQGGSKLAANSFKVMQSNFGKAFDGKAFDGKLAAELDAYAARGFTGERPDLLQAQNAPNAKKPGEWQREFALRLADQALVEWVLCDPAIRWQDLPVERQANRRRLARTVAAYGKVYLDSMWTPGDAKNPRGTFHTKWPGYITRLEVPGANHEDSCDLLRHVAQAYDFTAPWMTADEARATRNFLFATAVDRRTDRGYPRKIDGVVENRGVGRGMQQRGTWSGFAEGLVGAALVVAGEESGADLQVLRTFLAAPSPDADGTNNPKDPYAEGTAWPNARKTDVHNLMRQIYHIQDGALSPWGFMAERESYFTFYSGPMFPHALMFIRQGGHNQYVSGYSYAMINHLLYNMYPFGTPRTNQTIPFTSPYNAITHHSGNSDHRHAHTTMLKWIFPDDPAVDLVIATRLHHLQGNHRGNCLFGLDPRITNLSGAMATVAKAKGLPLTKTDPEQHFHILRSDWSDQALHLDFEAGGGAGGHSTCEKNSFSLFALGRPWAVAAGFHKIFSNWYSGIQVQHPEWKECPTTQGYVGMHPCYPPEVPGCDLLTIGGNGKVGLGGTGPTKVLQVAEGPGQLWSLVVGDATHAYRYLRSERKELAKVVLEPKDYLYPAGLLDDMISRCPFWQETLVNRRNPYYGYIEGPTYHRYAPTDVANAIRSVLLVRGKRPYVLIVDDFRKGDQPANYRWMMTNPTGTKADNYGNLVHQPFSMVLAPGATPNEGVLLHLQDAGQTAGLPRLLVRDLSENDHTGQPALRMDQASFKPPKGMEYDFYLNHTTYRLLIERQQVVDPNYKVLLFPFRTGEPLPITTWNQEKTELIIDHRNGTVDTIRFSRKANDPRSYLSLTRK